MDGQKRIKIDLGGFFFWPAVVVLFVLTVCEPDLLDALTAYVQSLIRCQ